VGEGAVQHNHGAIGAGAVQKGQIVNSFHSRFILCSTSRNRPVLSFFTSTNEG
jgi:hypothetical protein